MTGGHRRAGSQAERPGWRSIPSRKQNASSVSPCNAV
nr:MAG TPA_asm: hypothetical protein [Caudoviricetes sp.]